jgi:hypothetical protein
MKVSKAIEYLSERHKPDEEILLMYWAKDLFDEQFSDLSEDIWNEAIESTEEDNFISDATSDIYNIIYDNIELRKSL